jgi:hypothetical protein
MKPLSAAELLSVWEQGLNQTVLDRALILLTAASPELDFAGVAKLSIGQRDARLVELRKGLFGARLVNTARCPQCSERVEWENEIGDICPQPALSAPSLEIFNLEEGGYRLQFRLPNSIDIAEVMENICRKDDPSLMLQEAVGLDETSQHDRAANRSHTKGEHASKALLKGCILNAEHSGKICDIDELPASVLKALSHRIMELDPQAEIRIDLSCPECSHHWEVLFDITGFLWAEINAWAERTLQTVHRLACAYGWPEREILSLSPARRQLYLGLVSS